MDNKELAQVGRPSTIADIDVDLLCDLLSTGQTVAHSCLQVGISVRTFNRCRNLGQDLEEEEVFQEFYFRTESARMKSVNHLLDVIYNQAQYEPKVAMWLIERIYPEQFSLKPEFRKTKEDIKAEEFSDKPQTIEISFGDDPMERSFKRSVKREELRKFLEEQNLSTDIDTVVKEYEQYLKDKDND